MVGVEAPACVRKIMVLPSMMAAADAVSVSTAVSICVRVDVVIVKLAVCKVDAVDCR